jgi:hypothetical protein
MPTVNIPQSAHSTIQKLIRFSEPEFKVLLDALAKATPSLDRDKFWSHVAKYAPAIEPTVIESLLDEVFEMDTAMSRMGMDINEFAESLAEAVKLAKSEKFPFEEKDGQILKARLVKIFEGRKGFNITMKAMEVLADQDRIFLHGRILTDIRSVFNEAGDSVDALVIVHTLRIHYAQDSGHKDFYVALDTSDIQALRDVLDRADEKAQCLRKLVSTTPVPYLDPEE